MNTPPNTTPTIEQEHHLLVKRLAKPGPEIAQDFLRDPGKAHLMHMIVGIMGEAGELLDTVKKHCIYNKPLDVTNIEEELGDLEFYTRGLRDALGIERDYTLRMNIAKLNTRYPEGYTDRAAQKRADKEFEKEASNG
jgi:NTP pyrophosphatase (non-canonical NTP hydrolase)